ncbi:hypothetical protein [Campylobacter fetus]|uniref:hypothetical protein n=1 Tax=Campylobacter fetus TaxID=196 RepID=UPI0005091FDC|nr:hypothetical protein [Campylobacter fetus]AIR78422.1 surface array protein B [Campylobacter fetus subsp. fetus 04/554]
MTISNASSALEGDFSINANNANGLKTDVITANKGAISINANGVSAISVGNLSAKSSITLNAGDASTSVKAGDIAADSVNVDLSKVLGTTTVGKIKSNNIIYKASELSADTEGKIALASKGNIQNFKAEVTGSLGDDKIELTTAATTSSVTLSGDLGVGNDTVDINKDSAVDALKTVNLSGLTNYATSTTKLKAADGDTLTFNGGSGNDSVEVSGTAIASLKVIGDFGGGNLDKLTLGTNTTAITGADSAVTIDITKVTNVDSTEINFTNGATDMSDKALTINGSKSNDQVTLKLLAATTKVKVDGDLGNQSGDEFTLDVTNAVASVTHIDLSELSTTKGIIDISALTSVLADVKGTKGNDIITLGDKASTAKGEGISIDGGDGNDTFVFKDAAKVTAVTDDNSVESCVIKNFAVGDKIKFDSFAAENKLVVVTSNVDDASATGLKTKFVDAAITAVNGLSTVADGDIFAYVNGTDTYVVYNKAGGTADKLDAGDIVVKLAGVKVGTDFNLQLIDGELHAVAIA